MDKDLSDHGAVTYNTNLSGHTRDLPNIDLSDHGAVTYNTNLSGHARDLPDVDLSDHGAVTYNTNLSGHTRDLPDVDLSDHGAISYMPKSATWGTDDDELAKQINIIMQATRGNTFEQVIPLLNAESLAKVVEYRYSQVSNMIENSRYGLDNDTKERLGTQIYMDLYMIDNIISTNPNCMQPIFNPSLYVGEQGLTDIFGVLEKYQQDLNNAGVEIPLINGSTGKIVTDTATGKIVTAQDTLQYLMTKNEMYKQENSGRRGL